MAEYKCLDCQCEFDTPELYVEMHGFTYGPGERHYSCPNCGSDDFINAVYCSKCGECIIGLYVKTCDNECYCEDCYIILDSTEQND